MANLFLLLFLATIFAVARAGPLGREFEAQNSEEAEAAIFELGDQNGDGQWSFEEFVDFVAKEFGYSKMQTEKMLEIPEMREIFDEFDTNGDGQWSMGEFGVIFDLKDNEAKRKMEIVEFKLMDSNGDGAVDYDEFVDFFAEKMGLDKEERDELAQSEEMHSAFEWRDKNGDGKIEMGEMVEMENGTRMSTPPSSPSSSPPESSTPPPSSSSPSPSTSPPFFPPPELIFGRIDANNDGFLVYKECMDFTEDYLNLSENQNAQMEESPIPAQLFEGIDGNEDGQISMGEFVDSYPDILGREFRNKMLAMIFDMADENGDGALDYEEFVDSEAEQKGMGYQKRNELARSERMRAEFEGIDGDGDGQISLGELMDSMDGQSGTSTQAPSTSTPTQTEPSTSTTQQMETTPEGTSTTTSNPFVPKMEEIFKQFDANNDGQWELDEALDYYGNEMKLTEERKERVGRSRSFGEIFDVLDTDGDGKLSLNEFENVMEMNPEEMVEKLFKVMDLDGDEFVEFGELVAFFGDMLGMDEEEREEFGNDQIVKFGFEEADKNGDGKLDLEEFKGGMLGGMSAKMIKNAMEM